MNLTHVVWNIERLFGHRQSSLPPLGERPTLATSVRSSHAGLPKGHAVPKADIEGCCINGGMRGLFLAYQNAVTETQAEVRVNLLLSVGTPALEIVSYLPYEGRLDLYPATSRPIVVRCPAWLPPERVHTEMSAAARADRASGQNALRIAGARPGSRIELR